jgi:hypothetical protein
MNIDELRRMLDQESPATEEEARATMDEMRSDPDAARALLLFVYALSTEDRHMKLLLDLVLRAGLMQLIAQAAEHDDQFALKIAELVTDGMDQVAHMHRANATRARRSGKGRKVRSA